eukprot:jgi/Botrbrau1/1380/Bobra.0063s0081.3
MSHAHSMNVKHLASMPSAQLFLLLTDPNMPVNSQLQQTTVSKRASDAISNYEAPSSFFSGISSGYIVASKWTEVDLSLPPSPPPLPCWAGGCDPEDSEPPPSPPSPTSAPPPPNASPKGSPPPPPPPPDASAADSPPPPKASSTPSPPPPVSTPLARLASSAARTQFSIPPSSTSTISPAAPPACGAWGALPRPPARRNLKLLLGAVLWRSGRDSEPGAREQHHQLHNFEFNVGGRACRGLSSIFCWKVDRYLAWMSTTHI